MKSAFWSEGRGIVARFFTALRFVLNDDEEGFEIDNPSVSVADSSLYTREPF